MTTSYQEFHERLWEYYEVQGRHDLPWRHPEQDGTFDPYKIMISEIMLQQTQVNRVVPKYQNFLEKFPNVQVLAQAELGAVLREWQGLGYNRRAKFLWQATQILMKEYQGVIPADIAELVRLPGVGKNTAGAIVVYAFNQPTVFIETNIRTVYIHHFFADKQGIDDKDLMPLIEQTLDMEQPRLFYWALMDYGTYLKQVHGNLNKLSNSYTKQSKFHGSKRQIRGAVIRVLSIQPQTFEELQETIQDSRLESVLFDLENEKLVTHKAGVYTI